MADNGPRILVDGEFDIRMVDGMFEAKVRSGEANWTFCYSPHQALRTHHRLGELLTEFMAEQNVQWFR